MTPYTSGYGSALLGKRLWAMAWVVWIAKKSARAISTAKYKKKIHCLIRLSRVTVLNHFLDTGSQFAELWMCV